MLPGEGVEDVIVRVVFGTRITGCEHLGVGGSDRHRGVDAETVEQAVVEVVAVAT